MIRKVALAAGLCVFLVAAKKPASIGQTLTDFGFTGRWAIHCGQPASPDNPERLIFITDGEGRFFESLGGDRKNAYVIYEAAHSGRDRLLLTIELNGKTIQHLTMLRNDNRIRTLSNRSGGHHLVKDGIVLSNGRPTPWLTRCGDKS